MGLYKGHLRIMDKGIVSIIQRFYCTCTCKHNTASLHTCILWLTQCAWCHRSFVCFRSISPFCLPSIWSAPLLHTPRPCCLQTPLQSDTWAADQMYSKPIYIIVLVHWDEVFCTCTPRQRIIVVRLAVMCLDNREVRIIEVWIGWTILRLQLSPYTDVCVCG